MARHGNLGAFDPSRESWSSYSERLAFYFTANEIADDKKQAVLLTACGSDTFQLLRSLAQPDRLQDKSYADLMKLLTDHYEPAPSPIIQRFKFNTREKKPTETISEYIAELKAIARYCDYKASLNDMLRDRLVCGVNDTRIQKALLQESKELTFQKALDIAQGIELAVKKSKQLTPASSSVQRIQQTPHDRSKRQHHRSTNRQLETSPQCYRCGETSHHHSTCRFKNSTCRACGKLGHIAKVCKTSQRKSQSNTSVKSTAAQRNNGIHTVLKDTPLPHQSTTPLPPEASIGQISDYSDLKPHTDDCYGIFQITPPGKSPPMVVIVSLNQEEVPFEVDTGAAYSLINKSTFSLLFPRGPDPTPTTIHLHTYTGDPVPVLGSSEVNIEYRSQTATLPVIVVGGNGPNLFGRDWMRHIRFNWTEINHISSKPTVNSIIEKYPTVFADKPGQLKGVKAKIILQPDARPKFCRPRNVSYFLRDKVNRELQRLCDDDIISPVDFSEWATPIVPVIKSDGQSIRICGDFKVTVNGQCQVDTYPLPRIEDLFSKLAGGTIFSKLDLNSAYLQVELEEESKKYTTINTPKGLFHYNRLPFGISSAPAQFQRVMESVLKDLDGVMVYLDDILVTGSNPEQHLKNLERVLERLQQANLTLKKQKCDFALSSVQYLGHIIDAQGLRPSPRMVEAVQAVPTPKNTSELKSYLGLIKYYMKFIPNLSTLLSPLHRLLNKGVKWTWTSEQQSAFERSKKLLQSAPVLVHFDPSKELLVAADASPYGIGGVLSHRMLNGDEKPIAYVSHTLSAAERNYSQLEKEGLAIVFAVKKFHQFLHGHRFTILSDHKPLKHLFAENRQTPTLACGRIQRWALLLNMYQYTIQHRAGKDMGNADALSRLPLPVTPESVPAPGDHTLLVNHLEDIAVTPRMIKSWTERDPVLSRVRRLVLEGWEDLGEDGVQWKPFQNRREELSVLDGCLLWGSRVIVPKPGQQAILDQLHDTHPGITKMKALARSYFWWPTIDTDIEQRVKECRVCQDNRPAPPTAPLHPWEWPNRAWSRLHIDHAGPYLGHTYLVVIDAHSKWLEVFVVNSSSAECTIQKLSSLFTTHGLPDQIVSDNSTGFSSQEFRDFTRTLGIRHTFTAPYHPSSNGLAERAVRTFKEGVAKLQGPIEKRITQFLFRYRITPQSTTGTSPAELLMNRKLRSTLDLAHPDVARKVHQKQDLMVAPKENRRQRSFQDNEEVYLKSFTPNRSKWVPGSVVTRTGPVSYRIKLTDGRIVRRHLDHIRRRYVDPCPDPEQVPDDDWPRCSGTPGPPLVNGPVPVSSPPPPNPHPLRRSDRPRRPVDRFTPPTSF